MKRNYLMAGVLTLAATAVLSLAITAAPTTGWQKVGQKGRTEKQHVRAISERTKYLQSKGLTGVTSQLRPELASERPTPVTNKRPSKNVVHRTMANPRGNMYAVVPRHSDMLYQHQAYIGKLDLASGNLSKMYNSPYYCPFVGDDYQLQGNAIRKGEVYCPSPMMNSQMIEEYVWHVLDLETGELLRTYNFGSEILCSPYTMVYDEKHDLFYGLSVANMNDGFFCVFDPNKMTTTGYNNELESWEYIKQLKSFMAVLAYDSKNDVLYGFDDSNTVYTIDPTTGDCFESGYLEAPGSVDLFTAGFSGQVTYSPMDEMFVMVYRDNEIQASRLFFINPENWEIFEGPVVTNDDNIPYISVLLCNDDFAPADAPELAAAPTLDFVKDATTGTITFTVPELTYYGVEIGSTPVYATVKVDDDVLFEGNLKAGETKTLNATLTEGKHELTLTTAIGENVSPVRTVDFYIGNDTPKAPTNVNLDIDRLTWKAPGSTGVNKGYVNTDALEYNVYVNDVMQNINPIEDTEYTLRMPADMKRATIEVEAVAKGKTSARTGISDVIGKALTLPVSYTPTRSERELFTVLNCNNDSQAWGYGESDGTSYIGFPIGYFEDANDWFVLPAINLPDADKLYNFTFLLSDMYENGGVECYEVYVARKPTERELLSGTCIQAVDGRFFPLAWEQVSLNFAVKEPGNYYIGVHCSSRKSDDSWGIAVRDMRITEVAGKTSSVPADAQKIEIVPGEYGALHATLSITLPTLDIVDKPLAADDELTVTVKSGSYSGKATGKPGETVSVLCEVDADGNNEFEIQISNGNGAGYARLVRQYVGIDTPLAPKNITGIPSEDNLSMNITWEAPGLLGENDAYVDPDEVRYNIYTRSGVSYYKVAENLTATSYLYKPGNPALDDYHVGPSAQNSVGESSYSVFVQDMLGKPYKAPVIEEWNTTSFTMMPYNFSTSGEYAASIWENTSNAEGLGLEGCKLKEGAVISFTTTGGPGMTRLILPKVSTLGLRKADFILRFWDYGDTPKLEIFGRRHGHEQEELIETIIPNNPQQGEWNDAYVALPEGYLDCPWIQIRVRAHLTGAVSEYLVFDSWQVFPDCEYDLGITSFEGPTEASIGDIVTYKVQVTNGGHERHQGVLTTTLVDEEGKVYASDVANVEPLTAAQVFERSVVFELNGSYNDVTKLRVESKVECADDENADNNTAGTELAVHSSPIPSVSDLSGTLNDDKHAELTWSHPTTTYGDYENFEYLPAFVNSDQLGMWKNVDRDKFTPAVFENGAMVINWEGAEEPCGWTVVDTEKLGLINDTRAYPLSGKQYLMCRSAAIPEDGNPLDYQSDKWLISPEVVGGTTLSFWLNCLTVDTEYLELWYSEKGQELGTISILDKHTCGDFKYMRSLSKSGSDTWEEIVQKLPNKARYFAIRYTSFDGLAVMIDNISFTPVENKTATADNYSLYRSENGGATQLIAENISGTSYTDATYGGPQAVYHLVANMEIDGVMTQGPKSNEVLIQGSAVEGISGATAVTGGHGEVVLEGFDGQKVTIAATDGKVVYNTMVRGQRMSLALDGGVYLVTIGKKSHKVVVK